MSELTKRQREALELLEEHGPLYGLELVSLAKYLHRGLVYVTLRALEDRGLLSSAEVADGDGLRRRKYQLTAAGREELR